MIEFKDWWDTEVDYSDSDGDRYVRVRGIAYSAWTAAKADSHAEIDAVKQVHDRMMNLKLEFEGKYVRAQEEIAVLQTKLEKLRTVVSACAWAEMFKEELE